MLNTQWNNNSLPEEVLQYVQHAPLHFAEVIIVDTISNNTSEPENVLLSMEQVVDAFIHFKNSTDARKLLAVIDNLLNSKVDLCLRVEHSDISFSYIDPSIATRYCNIYTNTIAYLVVKTQNEEIIKRAFPTEASYEWDYGQVHPYLIALSESVKNRAVIEYLKTLFSKSLNNKPSFCDVPLPPHAAAYLQHAKLPELLQYRSPQMKVGALYWKEWFIDILNNEIFHYLLKNKVITYTNIVYSNQNIINWVLANKEQVEALALYPSFWDEVRRAACNDKGI